MTTFEHAMLGANLALDLGSRRRHGWNLAIAAGLAGALPDWDGLSIVLGGSVYANVHRLWGHNLLVASCTGLGVGGFGYLCRLSTRTRRAAIGLWERVDSSPPAKPQAAMPPTEPQAAVQPAKPQAEAEAPTFSWTALAEWLVVCLLAGVIHLPADAIYSGYPGMMDWPIKPFWPFAPTRWAWPIVPWGDVMASAIFVAEMFALYRWPSRAQSLAWLSLLAVLGYVSLRLALDRLIAQ